GEPALVDPEKGTDRPVELAFVRQGVGRVIAPSDGGRPKVLGRAGLVEAEVHLSVQAEAQGRQLAGKAPHLLGSPPPVRMGPNAPALGDVALMALVEAEIEARHVLSELDVHEDAVLWRLAGSRIHQADPGRARP